MVNSKHRHVELRAYSNTLKNGVHIFKTSLRKRYLIKLLQFPNLATSSAELMQNMRQPLEFRMRNPSKTWRKHDVSNCSDTVDCSKASQQHQTARRRPRCWQRVGTLPHCRTENRGLHSVRKVCIFNTESHTTESHSLCAQLLQANSSSFLVYHICIINAVNWLYSRILTRFGEILKLVQILMWEGNITKQFILLNCANINLILAFFLNWIQEFYRSCIKYIATLHHNSRWTMYGHYMCQQLPKNKSSTFSVRVKKVGAS